jgi:hypothetical protein
LPTENGVLKESVLLPDKEPNIVNEVAVSKSQGTLFLMNESKGIFIFCFSF